MEDVIKIVKSLEDSDLLLKWVTEAKEQKWESLSMLLGTLGTTLLDNRKSSDAEETRSRNK